MYADLPLLGREDRVLRELYLYWYILKNTFERVISGFIHTQEYRERGLYLDWYRLKNTFKRVISGFIHTQEYRESCIWIDTDLFWKHYWSKALVTGT